MLMCCLGTTAICLKLLPWKKSKVTDNSEEELFQVWHLQSMRFPAAQQINISHFNLYIHLQIPLHPKVKALKEIADLSGMKDFK